MKLLITGNAAGAWAAKLAKPQYIPTYPITPQTEVIETLELWKSNGDLPYSNVHQLESEHSVMSAAISASATGSRVYTATSSQGLLLMHEMMFIASGNRLPIVMNNISRGVSAPITLWADHQDFLDCRDTGWIMLHAKNVQEVLDFTLMAFKIAEHPDVLLPVMVNMDGYELSYTEEIVDIPNQEDIDEFLGVYESEHNISPDRKLCVGAPCMADHYAEFKLQQIKAMDNAIDVIEEVFEEFETLTGRYYDVVDYKYVANHKIYSCLISQGSMSTTVRYVADKRGISTLNLNVIRPLPHKRIYEILIRHDSVGILDRNIMPGRGGIMNQEIKEIMFDDGDQLIVENFIIGLGGKPITEERIEKLIEIFQHRDLKDIRYMDGE